MARLETDIQCVKMPGERLGSERLTLHGKGQGKYTPPWGFTAALAQRLDLTLVGETKRRQSPASTNPPLSPAPDVPKQPNYAA